MIVHGSASASGERLGLQNRRGAAQRRARRVRFPCASALPILLLLLACRGEATAPVVHGDEADRASRDRLRQPDRVIAALGLAAGQRVADIGAGHGYLTFRVVATDIDGAALAALRAHRPARANVVVRRVAAEDPGLEPAAFDLLLLSEVDHELADRVGYLRRLRAALAPDGRLAVTNRRAFRAPLLAAAERAGYTVAGEVRDLPNHFLVLLRPAPL
jgi:SAM-dependent methyltransferase